jgi:hypothetical protein
MSSSEDLSKRSDGFHPEDLIDVLPIYYNRLFPYEPFIKWLTYGKGKRNLISLLKGSENTI